MKVVGFLALLLYCFFYSSYLFAQEESVTVYQAKKYIDFNLKASDKYNKKVSAQQTKLLGKLKKKESRYAKKLKRKDSTAYSKYKQDPLTYDSISTLNKSKQLISKTAGKKNAAIDSLKGIKKFIEDKAHVTGEGKGDGINLNGYDSKFQDQQSVLNHNQKVNELIGQRTSSLKDISGSSKKKIGSLKSIDKNVFYSSQKIKAYKEISDEPSKAEEKALEHLQGQEGFDSYLENATGNGNPTAGKSKEELERMGYQTKSVVNKAIQSKLDNSHSSVQQNMGSQVSKWSDKAKGVKGMHTTAKQTKQSLTQAKHLQKPSFKVNPMRGVPLSKRIEKQLNWQTTRATLDGKPAVFQLSAMAGFKHTPKLTYGLGVATATGLGQNWNAIKITFEGIGLRTYTAWQWRYGIGAYVGYERMYKRAAFVTEDKESVNEPLNNHNTKIYNESVLVGLTKSYRINDKINGSFQVLYDIWWQEKGLRSPVQIRMSTTKNN